MEWGGCVCNGLLLVCGGGWKKDRAPRESTLHDESQTLCELVIFRTDISVPNKSFIILMLVTIYTFLGRLILCKTSSKEKLS